MPGQPERIAILGGGAAALAAAYELTRADDWSEHFQVTVYQLGWRLGGKGASGRNPLRGQRIEEHGLHVWPGFYDNAFRMMRECYAALNRPQTVPIRRWNDAFEPLDHLAVEEAFQGESAHWLYNAHRNPGQPGDPRDPLSLWELADRVLETMISAIRSLDEGISTLGLDPWEFSPTAILWAPATTVIQEKIEGLRRGISERMRDGVLAGPLEKTLEVALRAVRGWLGIREALLDRASSSIRRLWIFIDLARTNLAGMLADDVFTQGLDPLDEKDYRSWLAEHGARPATIDSALIRGLYDFVFAEVAGGQNLGAGAAIRLSLRTGFGYQGAIMYRMRAGMGDVVFAPLYEYLTRRGVKFQFFHRVRKLGLSADKRNIDSIELGIQATPTNGNYDPLVLVRGLPCWPNCPRHEQLTEGEELKIGNIDLESCWSGWSDVASSVVRRGSEFDRVILGISLGGLPAICTELVASIPRWRELLEKLPTIATGAAQLWWNASLSDLGWRLPSPVLTGYEPPFDTWADMSQTIGAEDWDAGEEPRNIAYLCGVLPDPDNLPPCGSPSNFPTVEHAAIRESLLRWLRQKGPKLWPGLMDPRTGDLRWDWFHAAPGSSGEARLDDQYWRGNFDPSGRYVQSPAGSLRYRLRPSESGVDNLFLAGDWTRNGINVGCVEAAVISGMRAARDLMGNSTPLPGESDESTIGI